MCVDSLKDILSIVYSELDENVKVVAVAIDETLDPPGQDTTRGATHRLTSMLQRMDDLALPLQQIAPLDIAQQQDEVGAIMNFFHLVTSGYRGPIRVIPADDFLVDSKTNPTISVIVRKLRRRFGPSRSSLSPHTLVILPTKTEFIRDFPTFAREALTSFMRSMLADEDGAFCLVPSHCNDRLVMSPTDFSQVFQQFYREFVIYRPDGNSNNFVIHILPKN